MQRRDQKYEYDSHFNNTYSMKLGMTTIKGGKYILPIRSNCKDLIIKEVNNKVQLTISLVQENPILLP